MAAAQHSMPRGSPTSRVALAVVLGLLVYASLFPIRGWTLSGLSPWSWLLAPIPPRYWTVGEVVSNVAAYIPLGLLATWAARPALVGWKAVVAATLLGALLSGVMESLQTYLPDRIASNLDFAANVLGTFLGAVLGTISAQPLIDRGRNARWRAYIFLPHTQVVGLLVLLWLLVQLSPQAMLFGTGDVATLLGRDLVPLQQWFPSLAKPSPDARMLAELLCTTLAVVGIAMLVSHCLRNRWLQVAAVWLLVAGGVGVKSASQTMPFLSSGAEVDWLTPGASRGLVLGSVFALLCCYLPRVWQRRLAIMALALQVIWVNAFPLNQYFVSYFSLGRVDPFYWGSLSRELAVVWPLAALLWMLVGRGSKRAVTQPESE